MAEHGTDRSAQILILLIFIETVEFIHKNYLNRNIKKISNFDYYNCFFKSFLYNLYYTFITY